MPITALSDMASSGCVGTIGLSIPTSSKETNAGKPGKTHQNREICHVPGKHTPAAGNLDQGCKHASRQRCDAAHCDGGQGLWISTTADGFANSHIAETSDGADVACLNFPDRHTREVVIHKQLRYFPTAVLLPWFWCQKLSISGQLVFHFAQ
jgi:hypothetical protein